MPRASRARELLPAVLMTLLSIVQALAFETLWSTARESDLLFAGGLGAWIGWLQVVAVFQGIVVIWLFYIGIVMRFSWVPSTWDSVAPFVLGALELGMIELIELGHLASWFYVLAAIFAFSTWISRRMFAAGAQDPTNPELAARMQSETSIDRAVPFVFVGALVVLGGIVQLAGSDGRAAVVCVVFANLLLLGQGALIQHYWRAWVGGGAGVRAG